MTTAVSRTTPADWYDAGLAVLTNEGPEGLTIDAMCSHLEITKGSFHHHFDGFADFRIGLFEYFEREGTLDIIDRVERESTPEDKLHRLLAVVVTASRRGEDHPELAFRSWAHHDEAVRSVQERIDERRSEYLYSLCRDLGDDEEARRTARLLHTAIVGAEQQFPPVVGEDLWRLFDTILASSGLDVEADPRKTGGRESEYREDR